MNSQQVDLCAVSPYLLKHAQHMDAGIHFPNIFNAPTED